MDVEITITKAELGQLGQPPSDRVKSFVWAQITRTPAETGQKIDLNNVDLNVTINVV